MSIIRSEISKKNKYWIDKDRYLELKHFCMQYSRWKSAYSELSSGYIPGGIKTGEKSTDISDPTANIVLLMQSYSFKIEMIEQTAIEADADIYKFIIMAATDNIPFVLLKTKYDIPCGKDMFYERYRKFFWILDKKRG